MRVTYREVALQGAKVEWRRTPAGDGEAPVIAGTTDRDGTAVFNLPAGGYFLVVRWRKDGDYARPAFPGDRFAYYGGNPVFAVRGVPLEIFIGVEEFSGAGVETAPLQGSGITGTVTADGAPLEGAHVSAYMRTESAFRDPGFAASAPTGKNGEFILDLPPGKYYVVARKRAGGGIAGPLRKGDRFGYYAANPLTVAAGRFTRLTIPATLLKMRNAPSYSADYKAGSSIEGRILDSGGLPRKGVYAALYDNPNLLGKPAFLSDVTGEDGRYRLPVTVPGTYFLGARSGYGGSPAPGGMYGRYEGTPGHSITIRDGDRLTGIDIVVSEVK